MNIDDMPAGAEMDKAVAVAIGWTHWQRMPITDPSGKSDFPTASTGIHDEWEPSTNIAHAWEVVEALDKFTPWDNGFAVQRDEGRYFAGMLAVHDGFGGLASAETAPLAICRAALKAASS